MVKRLARRVIPALALTFAVIAAAPAAQAQALAQAEPPLETGPEPPPIAREFRGVWIASVRNIDWPSKPGLPVAKQKAELIALLDRCVALKINAVVLQVRPACDALYDSPYEPWSEYLTGRQGQPPSPYYDPLAFAVDEAHARGLELHAWFNPYRARLIDEGQSPADPTHVSVAKPRLVKRYGRQLWLDPGEPEVQDHSLKVMLDVAKRYDIDAVHMDDYFYPYREPVIGLDGKPVPERFRPFPDDASYGRYTAGGGTLSRDDWRRENVNNFVKRLYTALKLERPGVKLGISPFGIWKPGHPPQIKGMNQYDAIYADAKLWLERGWVDYFAPQLYWSIENPDQSYPVLLRWWVDQNKERRHVWPGLFTSRVRDKGESSFDARQLAYQILWTRLQPGATGHIHFSMRAIAEDARGIAGALSKGVYQAPALVPTTPWLAGKPPAKPRLTLSKDLLKGTLEVSLAAAPGDTPWLWAVYTKRAGRWRAEVRPADQAEVSLPYGGPDGVEALDVSLVDRQGQEGPRARVVIRTEAEGGPAPQP